jgi:hypothetical protein
MKPPPIGLSLRSLLAGALLAATATTMACGGAPDLGSDPAMAVSALTCSQIAEQYRSRVDDATLCTVGDDSTCMGRMPALVVEVDGNRSAVEYGIEECPVPGSGIAVNPARTAPMEALLSSYREKGCDLTPSPCCGAPGRENPVGVCAADLGGRCRMVYVQE